MNALLAAALLAAVLLVCGGSCGLGGGPHPDRALSVAAFLAVWILVETQVAAAWRFSPAAAVALLFGACLLVRVLGSRPGGQAPSAEAAGAAERRAEIRLLLLVALALAVPLLRLPLPFDTDAQGFGQLALAIRDGGSLVTLAPWRPGISYLYAPGALTLFATLSAMLPGVPMSSVMMGAAHAISLLFVALSGSFGEELGRAEQAAGAVAGASMRIETWRRAAQLGAVASLGLWTALLDAHYTAVIGLTLALAGLVTWVRMWRTASWRDATVAGIFLAALVVTHQDTAFAAALGLVPLFAVTWMTARSGRGRLLARTAAGVLLAGALLTPWMLEIVPLVRTGIASPFRISATHARQLVLYHGVAWPLLALAGIVFSMRLRLVWGLGMLAWLVLLADFSTVGVLQRLLPSSMAPLTRFVYPFSLAWHGPVLPYLALGTAAIVGGAGRRAPRLGSFPGTRTAWAAALVVALVGAAAWPLFGVARRCVPFYGVLAGENDVLAMLWVRRETPRAARVLNYPGDFIHERDWEGHWAPVLTERDCVYMRMQPFFLPARAGQGGAEDADREQKEMLAFWRDPADPSNASRLGRAGIRYVVLPEAVGDPASVDRAWRGRPPALFEGMRSQPDSAPFLTPVFRAGGAVVYEVR